MIGLPGNDVEDECLYTLCNVVEAGLVKLPEYWDAVCNWSMDYGQSKTLRRPDGFFDDSSDKTLMEELLTLMRPDALYPGLGDAEARERLRDRARKRSHTIADNVFPLGTHLVVQRFGVAVGVAKN